jgi:uncharacterized membrane protein
MKKNTVVILAIIAISFLFGIYFYPLFPDKIASHWGIDGQVNGYMNKFWGLFLMPIISVVLFLLFIFLPKIDPLKENIKKFQNYFDKFILLIFIFLFYIYSLTILWNLGKRFNMGQLLAPAIGILFAYAGVLIENAKRNYFIGIRTPWTLASENVWNKTHKLGGKLFKISGIIAIFGFLFPDQAVYLVIIPVIISTIYSTVYSYLEFKKENSIDKKT